MFTRSKNYYIHKTLIFTLKKETISKRLLPKVRGEGKTVNQSAATEKLRGGRWLAPHIRKEGQGSPVRRGHP